MATYDVLIKAIDSVRHEAPSEYKTYHAGAENPEEQNYARSLGLLHMIVKVRHGVLEFGERFDFITDGPDDGGIDAYYIDREGKVLFFYQLKFRINQDNFEKKQIETDEILKMDIERILQGEEANAEGKRYNSKILRMIGEIRKIDDIGKYKNRVVLVGNVIRLNDEKIRRLLASFPYEILDYKKIYNNYLFPLISATYFSSDELVMRLDLSNKYQGSKIGYTVELQNRSVEITVLFVPTAEIARAMSSYKNAILKYNPRCYLDLENNVNEQIKNTIVNTQYNEFSLYNNGITIVSLDTKLNEYIGKKGSAQLILVQPQIINGGQTAFTLSKIFDDSSISKSVFDGKEVLVKIITFSEVTDHNEYLKLINSISNATNSQSVIEWFDRYSNDKIQIDLQRLLFQNYGIFYERKRGEFLDAINNRVIDAKDVLDKNTLRAIVLIAGGEANTNNRRKILKDEKLYARYYDSNSTDAYAFGVSCLQLIRQFVQSDRDYLFGKGSKHASFPILLVCYKVRNQLSSPSTDQALHRKIVLSVLKTWNEFEEYSSQLQSLRRYFTPRLNRTTGEAERVYRFDSFYKSTDLQNVVDSYFAEDRVRRISEKIDAL